jgi:hypothetical protein
VIGAGVLLVLAAGCAQRQPVVTAGAGSLSTSQAVPTSGSTVPGPALPGVHLPAGAEPVPGTQVDASALPADFSRLVWTEDDGTTIGLDGEEGGCMASKATVTSQTDTRVVVQILQQHTVGSGHACPMYLRYQPLSVHLDSALGHRTVVLRLMKG